MNNRPPEGIISYEKVVERPCEVHAIMLFIQEDCDLSNRPICSILTIDSKKRVATYKHRSKRSVSFNEKKESGYGGDVGGLAIERRCCRLFREQAPGTVSVSGCGFILCISEGGRKEAEHEDVYV